MVLIVTLNPSIDLLYHEKNFSLGAHNRFNNSKIMAAGKGINCSRALSYLGLNATSLAVVGGRTGELFKQYLSDESFESIFIPISDKTRHAITIMHNDGIHTEIVEEGPKINDDVKKLIFTTILETVLKNKIKIISLNGSVRTDDTLFYNELIAYLRKNVPEDTIILADFSRKALDLIVNQSEYKPDFIKPNMEEFSDLAGQNFTDKSEIIHYLKEHPSPIPYTFVSCGEQGAIVQIHNQLYDVTAPKINLVNPTGSGDSTVAGAIFAFYNKFDKDNIIRYAIASGTANAMEDGVGIAKSDIVQKLLNEITITEV